MIILSFVSTRPQYSHSWAVVCASCIFCLTTLLSPHTACPFLSSPSSLRIYDISVKLKLLLGLVLVGSAGLIRVGIGLVLKACMNDEENSRRRLDEATSATANLVLTVVGAGVDTASVAADLAKVINVNAGALAAAVEGITTVAASTSSWTDDTAPLFILSSGAESLTPTAAMVASAAVGMAAVVQGAMGAGN